MILQWRFQYKFLSAVNYHGAFILKTDISENVMNYYPSYYNRFSCIAGKCFDSCCKAWEIVIDEKTIEIYKKLDNDIGRKIREFIETDANGDKYFRLVDGKCPFLNSDNLCDIHIALGEGLTSEICRVHPRFIEEYDGFTEISLSLSCPAAAEIIVENFDIEAVYPIPAYNGDDDVLKVLINSRKRLLNCTESIFDVIKLFLKIASEDEFNINCEKIEPELCIDITAIKNYCKFIADSCEALGAEWKITLMRAVNYNDASKEWMNYIDRNNEGLLNIFRYYVYRYYLKAVNDLDIMLRARFIVFSVLCSAYISFSNDISLTEAARLYSKEIEHSTENIDILLDNFSLDF